VEEILQKYRSGWITTVGLFLFAIIVIGIAIAIDSTHERSTAGVVTISDYEATISKGDVLVLTNRSGKTTNYWNVIYDGNKIVTVKQDTSLFPSEHSGSVCGVGCSQELSIGLLQHLTITERPNHKVSVKWEWGWGYQRYQQ
jgi:hypothetical protein